MKPLVSIVNEDKITKFQHGMWGHQECLIEVQLNSNYVGRQDDNYKIYYDGVGENCK